MNKNAAPKNIERYNEKNIVKKFLNGEHGINHLIDKVKDYKMKQDRQRKGKNSKSGQDLLQSVDEIIDFYVAWIYNCPSKNIYRGNHYEGIKVIEKYCEDPEIYELFDYLLK